MDLVKIIISIILICLIIMIAFFIIDVPKEPRHYHTLTIDTHGIDAYFLTITSVSGVEKHTLINDTFSKLLIHGEYFLDVCYWNVNNTKKCEGQRVWLDEDKTVDFFVDVIE